MDQVTFLLACIKHTVANGKIDFGSLATELNLPSKAAAAKRYERLKKRALATDFSSCTAPYDCADYGGDQAVTAPKPKGTPVKPRTKGKAVAATTTKAAEEVAEDGCGEPSVSATTAKGLTAPRATKRKRAATNATTNEDVSASFELDTDRDANDDTAESFTGSHFVAVNTSPTYVI
ncbi:MAG: hypothetical protein STHCBS139747_000342 [Sporothrix thermara]